MTFYDLDLVEEALKSNLDRDIILKFVQHTKKIVLSHKKESTQYKQLIMKSCNLMNEFAQIGEEEVEHNDLIPKKTLKTKVSILSDTAEYTIKEVSEILDLNYKYCNKLFVKYQIPYERRESFGYVYRGKIIKELMGGQSNHN